LKAKYRNRRRWPEFQNAAKNLGVEAEKLRDAAKAKNEQLTQDREGLRSQRLRNLLHPVLPAAAAASVVALRPAAFAGAGVTPSEGGPAPAFVC
jgi:hypothetical protein